MVNIATLNGHVHLYVVHTMDEVDVVNMLEYHPDVKEGELGGSNGGCEAKV